MAERNKQEYLNIRKYKSGIKSMFVFSSSKQYKSCQVILGKVTHVDHARTDFYLPRLFNDLVHCSEGSSRNIDVSYRPTVEDWRSSDDLAHHFDDSDRHFDDLDHHFDDLDRHFDDVCDSRKHHRNAGTLLRNAYIILFKFRNIQFSNGVIKWSLNGH